MINKKLIGIVIAVGLSVFVFTVLTFFPYAFMPKRGTVSETTILPGSYPQSYSCAIGNVPFDGSIINSTGFDVRKVSGVMNYVISPGTKGIITYELTRGKPISESNNQTLPVLEMTNITNSAIFIHQGTTHTGSMPDDITIYFSPKFELLKFNDSSYVTATFYVSNSTTKGTYWFTFNPGPCHGPPFYLFTVE